MESSRAINVSETVSASIIRAYAMSDTTRFREPFVGIDTTGNLSSKATGLDLGLEQVLLVAHCLWIPRKWPSLMDDKAPRVQTRSSSKDDSLQY
jgi:hypothetical protein